MDEQIYTIAPMVVTAKRWSVSPRRGGTDEMPQKARWASLFERGVLQ
jgi:hypothetical protein